MDQSPHNEPRAGLREWAGLAVLALPTLLVSLDLFVILLAVPHISADLRASATQELWILDIYGFMVAGFLMTMGTLGDRIGRRRLLLVGATMFGVVSLIGAYSASPEMLIGTRALLGIAGATLTPSTLSLIMTLFVDSRQRATAVAIWAGCFVAGAIIGPIVGGVLLERFWWGSVFLLGVPAMAMLLVTGPRLLPEYRNPEAGRLDVASVALSLAAILSAIYGLKELARHGWETLSVAAVVAGLVCGVAFVRRQRALAEPLLDLRLFASRAFNATLGSMVAFTMFSGGTMVAVAQYLQLVEGLSPLDAGLALVPGMVAAIAGQQLAPVLARWIRPAYLIAGGLVVSVAGLVVLTQPHPASDLAVVVGGFLLLSLGGGPLTALGTNLVVGSAPPERAGSAAGVAQTGNELGYALGIATLGSLGTFVYRIRLAAVLPGGVPADAVEAARESIAGAVGAASSLPDRAAVQLLAAAHDAFSEGLHAVAIVAVVVLVVVVVVVAGGLGHLPPVGRGRPAEGVLDPVPTVPTPAVVADTTGPPGQHLNSPYDERGRDTRAAPHATRGGR